MQRWKLWVEIWRAVHLGECWFPTFRLDVNVLSSISHLLSALFASLYLDRHMNSRIRLANSYYRLLTDYNVNVFRGRAIHACTIDM